jgi:hypothetical protein
MAVTSWHKGKLVILWAWGVLLGGLALTASVTGPPNSAPTVHLLELLFSIAVPLVLSILTWRWLGAREDAPGVSPKG